MWTVWNKTDEINGFSADFILDRNKHLANEDVIYIKTVNGRVTQIEGKMILASVYGINADLLNDEFIAEYERILSEPIEEPAEITGEAN
jgi:hypothetical protein